MINPDEIREPLSFIGSLAVSPVEQHQRLPPPQKTLANVSLAAHLLGWCGYLAPVAWEFISALWHAKLQAPDEVWIPVAAWAFVTLIAVLWLLAAWKAAEGPRNPGAALWRVLIGAGCAALLWYRVYPDWGPVVVFLLKGIYIGWLVSHVARFLVAAQIIGGGSAKRRIRRLLKARNAPLRPAGTRRFFFL
jgi:hypothetical protein